MSLDKYVVEVNNASRVGAKAFEDAFVLSIDARNGAEIFGATHGKAYRGSFIGTMCEGILFRQYLRSLPNEEIFYLAATANPQREHSYSGTYKHGALEGPFFITRLDQLDDTEMALLRRKVEFPEV